MKKLGTYSLISSLILISSSLIFSNAHAIDGVVCQEHTLSIYQTLPAGNTQCRRVLPATLERSYTLCVPSKLTIDPEPVPLLLAFHGGGDNANATAFQNRTQWEVSGLKNEFIVAYPNGCGTDTLEPGKARALICNSGGYNKSWNTQGSIPRGVPELCGIDDRNFVAQVILDIQNQYPIKPDRIFAVGHSKGAMMAYSLACDLSSNFAAIGVTAATLTDATCLPQKPVSIFHVHNLQDPVVPFEGGGIDSDFSWPSAREGLHFWADKNGCALTIAQENPSAPLCTKASCPTGVLLEVCLIDVSGDTSSGDVAAAHRYDTYDQAFSAFNYNKKKNVYKNIRDAFAERYLE